MSETPSTFTQPKPSFDDFLVKVTEFGIPAVALESVSKDAELYRDQVSVVNGLVTQINASRAQGPDNLQYIDGIWEKQADSSSDVVNEDGQTISEIEAEFQELTRQREEKLAILRAWAKTQIKPPLDPEAEKAARKKVNESTPVLEESRKAIGNQLKLVETMLATFGVQVPEGGLVSLLPIPDSLKGYGKRGRKAATESGGIPTYMTRVGDVLIDGKSTRTEKGGKFDYAAAALSERFGKSANPENEVTAEELEEAFFASLEIPFRSKRGNEIPDTTEFTFTKNVKVKNPTDGSWVEAPETVTLTVISAGKYKADNGKAETPKAEESKATEESKAETVSAEKVETETPKAAPAKKAPAKK